MLHTDFFQKYYQLQIGVMGDKVVETQYGKIVYKGDDKSTFWNHLFVDKIISPNDFGEIEEIFLENNRTPAVYFEKSDELNENNQILVNAGYKEINQDSWMFFEGDVDTNLDFSMIKKVESDVDLKTYLDTFDKCYQNGDPQNPYGTLGDYLGVTEKVWHSESRYNHLEYFIVYKDVKPVAVATLTNYQGLGYISNVGSLREVRGQGFGKLATLKCVDVSLKNGNIETCLATEEGNHPNEFYKRIGFETKFFGLLYTKK